jgi:hypothetical protein
MSTIDITNPQSPIQSQYLMAAINPINPINPIKPIKPAPRSYADILKKGTDVQKKGIVQKAPMTPTSVIMSESPILGQISSSSSTTASYNSTDSSSDSSLDSSLESDVDSPILKCGNINLDDFDISNFGKSVKTKKSHLNETDFLNPNWKLPGGKKYQKDGVRLENAFYNGLPKRIKSNISTNVKPRSSNGNVIVEFDMIYQSDSSKRIISFEIKGVNPNTINNLDRQKKLIAQCIRQKKYLEENFSNYKVDCVYCFVTGKIKNEIIEEPKTESEWMSVTIAKPKSVLDPEFVKKIKSNGVGVAIGETPQQCAKNALIMLNLLR